MEKKILVFDMDDTLYLRKDPYLKAYRELFACRLSLDEEELYRISRKWSEITFRQQKEGEISLEQMHVDRVILTYREMGASLSLQEALHFQERYAYYQDHITLREGMEQILAALKAHGRILGLLSNGPGDHQRKKYKALGLDAYIPESHVMISGDLGIHKPETGIFRAYEEKLLKEEKLGTEGVFYMIGDSLETDIAGAKAAGWKSIHLKNPELEEESCCRADFEAADVKALWEILKDLGCAESRNTLIY
ncbi:MAG: HAD family hydrolase [Lachnospiraceae bacterium]|nr:HAD family hydrolase [Lachnospiraceae bacterium]